jgi:hypothetical protein
VRPKLDPKTVDDDKLAARFSTAPLAIATDGSVLVNVAQLLVDDDVGAIIEEARRHKGPIFVGVPMSRAEVKTALRALDDAAAEVAAHVGGARIKGMR